MSSREALETLLAKVEAGDGLFPNDFPSGFKKIPRALGAYEGSLDAAKALHDAVFPGRTVNITDLSPDHCGGHGWNASINWQHTEWLPTYTAYGADAYSHSAYNPSPARAWLIAILKALIAQQEDQQ